MPGTSKQIRSRSSSSCHESSSDETFSSQSSPSSLLQGPSRACEQLPGSRVQVCGRNGSCGCLGISSPAAPLAGWLARFDLTRIDTSQWSRLGDLSGLPVGCTSNFSLPAAGTNLQASVGVDRRRRKISLNPRGTSREVSLEYLGLRPACRVPRPTAPVQGCSYLSGTDVQTGGRGRGAIRAGVP